MYIYSASTNTEMREKLARSTRDPKLLSRLAYDNSKTIREIVSKNPATPEYALRVLAKDPSYDIRRRVAKRTHDNSVFRVLSEDPDETIRMIVANRCKAQDILADMIFDESWAVRQILPQFITDSEVLAMIAEDDSPLVRLEVVKVTRDVDILNMLKDDPDELVSTTARNKIANRNSSKYHPASRFRNKYEDRNYTDWSVSPFEIQSYSEIESEIDEVIDIAVDEYATSRFGEASVDIDGTTYDNATTFKIVFRDRSGKVTTYSSDIEEILAPATSNNKKSKCIQNVETWLKQTFG